MIIDEHKLYIFGGTDGAFHYNDTWCFDLATNVWTELQCIGYVPVAREGCAASLVDGVMYVFGGRDVNGKDLGDLAAFKISSKFLACWLDTFAYMRSFSCRPKMVHVPEYGSFAIRKKRTCHVRSWQADSGARR